LPALADLAKTPMGDEPFVGLICLMALDVVIVKDETRLLAFTQRELMQAENWLAARHLHASDNIMRKRRLEQPACCIGVLELI